MMAPKYGLPRCPECKEEAVLVPPKDWKAHQGPRPNWSHKADGTQLCLTVGRKGYEPSEVEK